MIYIFEKELSVFDLLVQIPVAVLLIIVAITLFYHLFFVNKVSTLQLLKEDAEREKNKYPELITPEKQ